MGVPIVAESQNTFRTVPRKVFIGVAGAMLDTQMGLVKNEKGKKPNERLKKINHVAKLIRSDGYE